LFFVEQIVWSFERNLQLVKKSYIEQKKTLPIFRDTGILTQVLIKGSFYEHLFRKVLMHFVNKLKRFRNAQFPHYDCSKNLHVLNVLHIIFF